jgi:uncharacterized repeat protein (TIGR01451 family)
MIFQGGSMNMHKNVKLILNLAFAATLVFLISASMGKSLHAASLQASKAQTSRSETSLAVDGIFGAADGPIIIDHTATDITVIPQEWLEEAKDTLHIAYGHTSHGSQLTSGMAALVDFANDGGLGLALPTDIFAYNSGGSGGALDLREPLAQDAGYYPQWVNETRTYLGPSDPATGRGTTNPEINVIIWAWCGQVSSYSEQQMLDRYLLPMTQLESDYPGIVFVYMTGHADGTGEEGNLHLRNQQIRDYCTANDKVLYDFYDIELYDPDAAYYGDKAVNDNCDYDSDGNGTRDRNWAIDWQNAHTEDADWYDCSCAHSQALNCNQKAYAAWWLWARIAGWEPDGPAPTPTNLSDSTKTVTPATVDAGDRVTYTVALRGSTNPPTATVRFTDTLSTDTAYVPGSLTATSGAAVDTEAPTLLWAGTVSPTLPVTITYSVATTPGYSGTVINTATLSAPDYGPIARTALLGVRSDEPPPALTDLSDSTKTVMPAFAEAGDRVTYTVRLRGQTHPPTRTVRLTDTLPSGVLYVPDSLTATGGTADAAYAPTLLWSGGVSPTLPVTITYAATVTLSSVGTLTNEATLSASDYGPISRTATLGISWYRIYLPLVLRQGSP